MANMDNSTVGVLLNTTNVPPTASSGSGRGQTGHVHALGLDSLVDQAAGFTYTINWGDGTPVQSIAATPGNGHGLAVAHTFADAGTYTLHVTATDRHGDQSQVVSCAR